MQSSKSQGCRGYDVPSFGAEPQRHPPLRRLRRQRSAAAVLRSIHGSSFPESFHGLCPAAILHAP
ncbi:hypothetical protein AK812_SmicGene47262, partial [Symbiodinium microadriaticum]